MRVANDNVFSRKQVTMYYYDKFCLSHFTKNMFTEINLKQLFKVIYSIKFMYLFRIGYG